MAAEALEGRFFDVLAAILSQPRESLSRDTSRRTTEAWDSLKHMHLMLALEEEFDIEFSDQELADIAEAGALLDVVASKLGA